MINFHSSWAAKCYVVNKILKDFDIKADLFIQGILKPIYKLAGALSWYIVWRWFKYQPVKIKARIQEQG